MKRLLLIGAGLLVGLPLLLVAGFVLFFDADAFRPRLAEAVQRATGREFRIEGPLRLSPALSPTISADGLVLANVEGGSSPEMLRIGHARLRLALWPLARGRIELRQLTLEGGRLLLERENWRFARPATPGPAPAAAPAPGPGRPLLIDIRSAELRDWRVTWAGEEVQIARMRLDSGGAGQPLDLAATIIGRGTEATVEGRIASPMLLAESAPWPFRLTATLPGARLSAEGERSGADWRANLAADVPRLDALEALAGRPLPALNGISLRGEAALVNGVARLERIEGRIAGGEVAGVALNSATFTQASLDAPLRAEASGQLLDQPFTLALEALPTALIAGTASPVAINAAAAGATLAVSGTWPGMLRVEAAVPALATFSTLAGRPLPPLRDAALRAAVTAEGPSFREGVRVEDFAFTSSGGDLAGMIVARWVPRLSVAGRVASTRLDLAAFQLPAPVATPAPAAAPPAPAAPAAGRVIPDIPLDLAALRRFDADVTFQLAQLVTGGAPLREVQGRLLNEGGRARLDPFAATLPGGRIALRVAADATAEPPALQVAGGGQGLDPVAMLGPQSPFTGRTDLDLDLRAQGSATRALAASATGHFGLAVTGGHLAGAPARALGQLPGFGGGIPVTCLALRGDADRGLVRLRTLYLEGGAGRLGGEGGLSLRDETLAIRLNTDLRVAGVRVRAPVPLTGTLAAPRLELAGLTEGALAGDLGRQLERAVPGLGALLPQQAQGAVLPDCATALRVARNGREGPVPAAAVTPQAQPERGDVAPALNNLLRGILGR